MYNLFLGFAFLSAIPGQVWSGSAWLRHDFSHGKDTLIGIKEKFSTQDQLAIHPSSHPISYLICHASPGTKPPLCHSVLPNTLLGLPAICRLCLQFSPQPTCHPLMPWPPPPPPLLRQSTWPPSPRRPDPATTTTTTTPHPPPARGLTIPTPCTPSLWTTTTLLQQPTTPRRRADPLPPRVSLSRTTASLATPPRARISLLVPGGVTRPLTNARLATPRC